MLLNQWYLLSGDFVEHCMGFLPTYKVVLMTGFMDLGVSSSLTFFACCRSSNRDGMYEFLIMIGSCFVMFKFCPLLSLQDEVC